MSDYMIVEEISERLKEIIKSVEIKFVAIDKNQIPYKIIPYNIWAKRICEEKPDISRSIIKTDRDRILYSRSWKSIFQKTAVYPISLTQGNYIPVNRGQHSIEVALLLERLAEIMFLNPIYAYTIGIGHDLGHCVFGHCGERSINSLLPWSNSIQTFRVVTYLENKKKKKNYHGLNLCIGSLLAFYSIMQKGLLKQQISREKRHNAEFDIVNKHDIWTPLECIIERDADPWMYIIHDLANTYEQGLINLNDLSEFPCLKNIWNDVYYEIQDLRKNLEKDEDETVYISDIIKKSLYNYLLHAYLNYFYKQDHLIELLKDNQDNIILFSKRIIKFDGDDQNFQDLKNYMYNKIYLGKLVSDRDNKAHMGLEIIINHYRKYPKLIEKYNSFKVPIKNYSDMSKIEIADFLWQLTDEKAINLIKEMLF